MGMDQSESKPQAGGQETSKDLDLSKLAKEFDLVFNTPNAFDRECLLAKGAKQCDMAVDEYRKLYESYCRFGSKRGVRKFRLSTLPRIGKWTGFAEKKLWDYVQLAVGISIPIVIFVAGQYFTWQTNNQQQQIANDKYHQDLLSQYFDQMTDLITKEQLLDHNKGKESQVIARARTLSTLRELSKDGERKGLLIKFLSEANLLSD